MKKRRFAVPAFNGYRDLLVSVAVRVDEATTHVCEVQVHHGAFLAEAAERGSYAQYAYFRDFCAGNGRAGAARLDALSATLAAAADRGELVTLNEVALGGVADCADDATLLESLARLLVGVDMRYAESVRARVATLQQRDRGRTPGAGEAREYASALCAYDGADPIEVKLGAIRTDLAALASGEEGAEAVKGGCLRDLALLLRSIKQYDEARPFFQKALALAEAGGGAALGGTLTDLAGLEQDVGRYATALPLYRRAIEVYASEFGVDDAACAAPLNNYAQLLVCLGDFTAAEKLYRRALEIQERHLGPEHPAIAAALSTLSGVLAKDGRSDAAEAAAKRSLSIKGRVYGFDHPEVAIGLWRLAALYEGQGEHVKAEPLWTRALFLYEEVFGHRHEAVAAVLSSLARANRLQGKHAAAEELYARELEVIEATRGVGDADVAAPLNNVSLSYEASGRGADAEPLLRRALDLLEAAGGDGGEGCLADDARTVVGNLSRVLLAAAGPGAVASLNGLAERLRARGEYGAAEPLLERALALIEAEKGPDHLHVAGALNSVGINNWSTAGPGYLQTPLPRPDRTRFP